MTNSTKHEVIDRKAWLRNAPSLLKGTILPESTTVISRIQVLVDIIEAKEARPAATAKATTSGGSDSRPYLVLDEYFLAKEKVQASRLVRRDCYDHLLPLVLHNIIEASRVTIQGTPGIGKTIFGFFVLRELIQQISTGGESTRKTVAYWDNEGVIVLSNDAHYKEKFGLNVEMLIDGEPWSCGAWDDIRYMNEELLEPDDIHVIHDPKAGFADAGLHTIARLTLIIVSFGHDLFRRWFTKGGGPRIRLRMPFFHCDEIKANTDSLFHGKQTQIAWSDQLVEQKYDRFGGSIRHWGTPDEESAWSELKSKVRDVVNSNGANMLDRTHRHQGSVLHIDVEFDKSKSYFPDTDHNRFDSEWYVLGSNQIRKEFHDKLVKAGRDKVQSFMASVNGLRGGEALYGLLFEIHAHDFLRNIKGQVNIRVVRRDGKNKNQYATIRIPVSSNILTFPGVRAKGIADKAAGSPLEPGTYIMPDVSNFPTYDSAVVVPGDVVGVTDKSYVGLLLQMTVSGATGVRRLPEHSVNQYVRTEMQAALEATTPGFDSHCISVTTFCVPSACFHPFLFQIEQRKDTDQEIVNQPDYQFVIEIPDFSKLETSTVPVGEIHGSTGRTHRYMLREGNPKKVKVEEIYETEQADDDCKA